MRAPTQREIRAKAQTVFGARQAARDWLLKPAVALDNERLADLLRTAAGRRQVHDLLIRLEHCVYT